MSDGTIKVKLTRGRAGTLYTHRKVLDSLGLRKFGQVRELKDCPEIRGQISKVNYLVSIVD